MKRASSATRLAKLSLPRLGSVLGRERLYARLDALRSHPLVWVEAPAGAGKTTLLGSYIEARSVTALWYTVDAGDRDVAALFHYLTLGAAGLPVRPRRLPRFSAEYQADLPAFARRFFQQLFAQCTEPMLLVFDALEDGEEALSSAVREAAAQAPAHVNVIVLSRLAWPPGFARMAANGMLGTLEGPELLLREDEAVAIARGRGVDDQTARALHREAEGWAAGFRLMLEGMARHGGIGTPAGAGSRQELFDYFADQLFAVASERTREALLDLSLLPYVTPGLARAVSASEDAIEVVDCLARQQLFAQRSREGSDPSGDADSIAYRFHALFQAFLREQLLSARGETGRRQLASKCARALRQAGDREAAVTLYLQAEAWSEAIRLIRQLSLRLLRDARHGLLLDWIAALPGALADGDEWLLYTRGSALLATDAPSARLLLERAYAVAAERDNDACLVRALYGIVDATFLVYTEFRSIDRWLGPLRKAASLPGVGANADLELRATTALLSATLYRHGNAAQLEALAERTLALASQPQHDLNLRASALAWLLSYAGNTGHSDLGGRVAPLAAALIARADVPPLRRGLCAYFLAWTLLSIGDHDGAERVVRTLARLASESESVLLARYALIIEWWIAFLRQDPGQARHCAIRYEQAGEVVHPYAVASLHSMHAWLEHSRGSFPPGRQHALIARKAYDQVASPWHRVMIRGVLLWSAVELEDKPQAQALMRGLDELVRESRLDAYALYVHQAKAWLSLRGGAPDLPAQLAALFDYACTHGIGMPMRFIPTWMSRLCAEALRRGIATAYVKSLIKTYRWRSPLPDIVQWPWPVKIVTLGSFTIQIDEAVLGFGAKAPRKALGLLKALICLGGSEVRDHQLIDALWKDEEADAARASFNVTLHRLRRLLGHHEAIEVVDGCLSLNPGIVWVDAFAFERGLPGDTAGTDAKIDDALRLYRGPLLPTDTEESWSAAARERLRMKFIHYVGRRARQLEGAQRWDDAVALYLRGLDADSLSESMYQGLMRCYGARGQNAEAMSLYWRLRQTLSVSLGIAPSSETEALFQEICSTARVSPV